MKSALSRVTAAGPPQYRRKLALDVTLAGCCKPGFFDGHVEGG